MLFHDVTKKKYSYDSQLKKMDSYDSQSHATKLPRGNKNKNKFGKYFFLNLFLYSNYRNIGQEMNKMAIHAHAIFRPRNAMFSLS